MKRVLLCVLMLLVPLSVAPPTEAARKGKARLTAFGDCGQLVRYANRHADRYEPGGPPVGFRPFTPPMPAAGPAGGSAEGAPAPAAAPTNDSAISGEAFSLTNNQEAGVFEPDIVKTDGETLYALTSAGTLNVVDVRGGRVGPNLLGSVAVGEGYGHQMLFDRRTQQLLVYWTDYEGTTSLAYVDVADPAAPA